MLAFISLFLGLNFSAYSNASEVEPIFPQEEPSGFREMVGRYELTAQKLGTCSKEVVVTTRHWANRDEIDTIGVVGFGIDRVLINEDATLRVFSDPKGYYDMALESLDPDMNFRFGNEFAMLRCRSFSCAAYPDGQKWLLRSYISKTGKLVLNEYLEDKETLNCQYKKVSVPTIDIRGTWRMSLYPDEELGSFSHYYETNLTVHCSDDGLINGVAKFERMNNGHYVAYAPLSGTCNNGEASIQFTATLENVLGKYEEHTFKMDVGEIRTFGNRLNLVGKNTKNYSVEVYTADGKKWGKFINTSRKKSESHY